MGDGRRIDVEVGFAIVEVKKLMDPSCGSGTFLFHAVHAALAAAKAAGVPITTALAGLANAVVEVDLHPAAMALARMTYTVTLVRQVGAVRGEAG